MSKVGLIKKVWQGGEHEFCLSAYGHLCTLEDNCFKSGIGAIFTRLANGAWGVNDIREPIRLGLMGAGMSAEGAMHLVKLNVDGNPQGLGPSAVLAMAILEAVIIGVPDDPVGKPQAAEATTGQASTTTMAASAAQPSSDSPAV